MSGMPDGVTYNGPANFGKAGVLILFTLQDEGNESTFGLKPEEATFERISAEAEIMRARFAEARL